MYNFIARSVCQLFWSFRSSSTNKVFPVTMFFNKKSCLRGELLQEDNAGNVSQSWREVLVGVVLGNKVMLAVLLCTQQTPSLFSTDDQ